MMVLIFREMVILRSLQSREVSHQVAGMLALIFRADGHPPCPPVQGGPHQVAGMIVLIFREMVILLALQSREVLIKWQV